MFVMKYMGTDFKRGYLVTDLKVVSGMVGISSYKVREAFSRGEVVVGNGYLFFPEYEEMKSNRHRIKKGG